MPKHFTKKYRIYIYIYIYIYITYKESKGKVVPMSKHHTTKRIGRAEVKLHTLLS